MATQYFFAHGDEQHGPYSGSELQELANAGKIQPTDVVWREGVGRRIPAWRVGNLFPGMQGPPPAEAPEAEAGAPPESPADSGDAKAAAPFTPADEKPAEKPPVKERPKRVVSIRGGTIASQDGKYVMYRKKCEKCGHEEQGKASTVIRPGSMKIPWFCRKCRKGRTVEMTAVG